MKTKPSTVGHYPFRVTSQGFHPFLASFLEAALSGMAAKPGTVSPKSILPTEEFRLLVFALTTNLSIDLSVADVMLSLFLQFLCILEFTLNTV